MPCDTIRNPGESPAARGRAIKESLARRERYLQTGSVKVNIGPSGGVAFAGWKPDDRSAVTDVCAYRTLMLRGSMALRVAVQRAEMLQGRKVNPVAVAAGVHSHDGGTTWGTH